MTPTEFRQHAASLRRHGAVAVRVQISKQITANKAESYEYSVDFTERSKREQEGAVGFAIDSGECD
jgi:hypothetical protein